MPPDRATCAADVQAGGVALNRGINEALNFGEGDDFVELGIDLAFAHAEYCAIEVDVLAAGETDVAEGPEVVRV